MSESNLMIDAILGRINTDIKLNIPVKILSNVTEKSLVAGLKEADYSGGIFYYFDESYYQKVVKAIKTNVASAHLFAAKISSIKDIDQIDKLLEHLSNSLRKIESVSGHTLAVMKRVHANEVIFRAYIDLSDPLAFLEGIIWWWR